jgi:tetratricopeptide (TPR) repeat protein
MTWTMKREIFNLMSAMVLLCFSAAVAPGQSVARKIYVREATLSAAPSEDERKIALTSTDVLELRLNSMKQLKVFRGAAPCKKTETEVTPQQQEEVPVQIPLTDPSVAIYEVKTEIKTLISAGNAEGKNELVLEYDLLRYVRCSPTSIIHRSEPISVRTAFEGLLQMGDILEVALTKDIENLAPPKPVVDLSDIVGGGDALQDIRDQLGNVVFFKLGTQPDFRARDFRGKPSDSQADYIVTGELLTKDQKGARFTVKSLKDNRIEKFFVPGPVSQKPPDEKTLAAFYDKSATMIVNNIRARRDNTGPLSDADVGEISAQAYKFLCKDQARSADCVSQPTIVIPMLTRLRDAEKASPRILELLGEAYEEVWEYQDAADAYDQAWMKGPNGVAESEVFGFQARAANALYAAHNYPAAAERYGQAINTRAKAKLPIMEALFVQYARSYRFAGNRLQALDAALLGMSEFSDSAALDEEVTTILGNLTGDELQSAYHSLMKYSGLAKVQQKLPDVKTRLTDWLIQAALENIFRTKKLDEADRFLKIIESLPLESLPQNRQKRYRIVRAVWSREARNDFDGAIAVLTPLAQEASEEGVGARYFLIDTLYKKARRAGKNADRADYERASEILRGMAEKQDSSLGYSQLLAVNHELGKDQESRDIIERALVKNGDDYTAKAALAQLCIEYMNDLECGEKNLKEIESRSGWDSSFKLRRVVLHLLRGQYAEAERLLETSATPPQVALFYKVWLLLALNRETQAETTASEWQTTMQTVRGSGQNMEWLFYSASRGIESEQKIPLDKKELLRQMIAAMQDLAQPLPKLTDFFKSHK